MEELNMRTDDELVALFMSGCNEAFDELLLRYQDRLYSYISYIVRNDDMADDLFQETFVKAIVTLRQGRYKQHGKFFAWLTRIAHNLLIDQFRNEQNEGMLYDEEAEAAWHNSALLEDSYRESEMVTEQVLKDVRRLMDHLPDLQREVVYMRFYQDLSFKEISDITGVSINTALGRMRYAILNMRRMAEQNHISLAVG
ncbi:MAG: RNA polymerase sigma factor [Alloprevotella sp.]|nr:RNA polymerase sigma factor [Alloprevotella sp.]